MPFPGRWWHKPDPQDAFWLSWVSITLTLIAGFGGVVGFAKTESSLILAFGLENFVDFLSSVVVLWRFYCPNGCDEIKVAKLKKREERANVAISFIIGTLGLFVTAVAFFDFFKADEDPENLTLLFFVAFVSILVFGSLTTVKFKYAQDLDCPSLHKDGICSAISTGLSGSLLLTTAIIRHQPKAWFIDPIVSLLVGMTAIFLGFRLVVKLVLDGVPIYHYEWWIAKTEGAVSRRPSVSGGVDLQGGGGGTQELTDRTNSSGRGADDTRVVSSTKPGEQLENEDPTKGEGPDHEFI